MWGSSCSCRTGTSRPAGPGLPSGPRSGQGRLRHRRLRASILVGVTSRRRRCRIARGAAAAWHARPRRVRRAGPTRPARRRPARSSTSSRARRGRSSTSCPRDSSFGVTATTRSTCRPGTAEDPRAPVPGRLPAARRVGQRQLLPGTRRPGGHGRRPRVRRRRPDAARAGRRRPDVHRGRERDDELRRLRRQRTDPGRRPPVAHGRRTERPGHRRRLPRWPARPGVRGGAPRRWSPRPGATARPFRARPRRWPRRGSRSTSTSARATACSTTTRRSPRQLRRLGADVRWHPAAGDARAALLDRAPAGLPALLLRRASAPGRSGRPDPAAVDPTTLCRSAVAPSDEAATAHRGA